MYIIFLIASFAYMVYGYFHLIKKKKSFYDYGGKYILGAINLIILIVLLIDLPFFVMQNKETEVYVDPIFIQVVSGGKKHNIDLITTYQDINGRKFWSGAPIGHKEWIKNGYDYSKMRVCQVKYLPVTKIIIKITENNIVVYNTLKDFITLLLILFFVMLAMVIFSFKEGIRRKD